MNLELSPTEMQFRADVRAFLEHQLPADISAKVLGFKHLTRKDWLRWTRILHEQGWSAPSWPKELGGPGGSTIEQHIFDEECSAAGAPPVVAFGVRMVAPVIMAFGNRERQQTDPAARAAKLQGHCRCSSSIPPPAALT